MGATPLRNVRMFVRRRHLAALLIATLAFGAAAQQPPPAAPSAYEMELWQAATRLNTPDAYQAYLKAFPNGAFAAMAKLSLPKTDTAAAATPQTAPVAAVASFSAPLETGSITLQPGQTLKGPGFVTVGWLGAKRQLVVPAGDWTLLAAWDHDAEGVRGVQMTSMALGQFAGPQLKSVVVARFNRKPIASPGGSGFSQSYQAMGVLPRWLDAERCEAAPAAWREAANAGTLRHCGALQLRAEPVEPALAERLAPALKALKAELPPLPVRSELHIVDKRLGYLAYQRLDCVPGGEAGAACRAQVPAAGTAPPADRTAWLKAFVPLAVAGYERDLPGDDLEPGRAATRPLTLPF